MKIFQYNCYEGGKVDMRQANAVLRHKPEVIIFEAPNSERTTGSIYNKFPPSEKPMGEFRKRKVELARAAKQIPWVKSDIYVYENISTLWKEGHDVKLYNVDGPPELLEISFSDDDPRNPRPYRRGTHFKWWVRMYLREKIMTKNIRQVLSHYKNKKGVVALNFLQKFHWRNVKFQLSKPSKNQMWNYYFGNFNGLDQKNIVPRIKEENKVLYKYWRKYSDFK